MFLSTDICASVCGLQPLLIQDFSALQHIYLKVCMSTQQAISSKEGMVAYKFGNFKLVFIFLSKCWMIFHGLSVSNCYYSEMLCCLVIFCVRNVYFCEFYEKKWYRIISEVNWNNEWTTFSILLGILSWNLLDLQSASGNSLHWWPGQP